MSIAPLIKYFASERGLMLPRDTVDDRRVLAALLTTREPGVIPEEVNVMLDTLLSEEAAARGAVEAEALPTLAAQGVASGPIAERVRLWRGDLTVLSADAIVNATNDQMLGCFVPGHKCIDNVIHAAAGPGLREECASHIRQQGHPEPTGTATLTSGYHLPSSFVIHTVGPIVDSHRPSTDDEAAQWIRDADRVLITAGAGMSAAAGFDYADTKRFAELFPALHKAGLHARYEMIGLDLPPEYLWGFWAVHTDDIRFNPGPTPLYEQLRRSRLSATPSPTTIPPRGKSAPTRSLPARTAADPCSST